MRASRLLPLLLLAACASPETSEEVPPTDFTPWESGPGEQFVPPILPLGMSIAEEVFPENGLLSVQTQEHWAALWAETGAAAPAVDFTQSMLFAVRHRPVPRPLEDIVLHAEAFDQRVFLVLSEEAVSGSLAERSVLSIFRLPRNPGPMSVGVAVRPDRQGSPPPPPAQPGSVSR
jgi:hypothetical protein